MPACLNGPTITNAAIFFFQKLDRENEVAPPPKVSLELSKVRLALFCSIDKWPHPDFLTLLHYFR